MKVWLKFETIIVSARADTDLGKGDNEDNGPGSRVISNVDMRIVFPASNLVELSISHAWLRLATYS